MRRLNIVASLVGISLGVVVGASRDASAAWVRTHSSECYNRYSDSQLADSAFGITNTGSGTKWLTCAVPDTSSVPKGTFTVANVEFWEGSASTSAAACYSSWNGQYGGCSATISIGGPGHNTIPLGSTVNGGLSSWWNTNGGTDFGYIILGVGQNDRIAGIYYQQ